MGCNQPPVICYFSWPPIGLLFTCYRGYVPLFSQIFFQISNNENSSTSRYFTWLAMPKWQLITLISNCVSLNARNCTFLKKNAMKQNNPTKLMHIFKQSLILWEIVQVQGNFFSLKFGGIESNCNHQIILPLCLLEILEFFSSLLWWGRGDYRWNSDFMSALQTINNWICTLPNLLPNMYKSSWLGHHFRDKLFIWSTS